MSPYLHLLSEQSDKSSSVSGVFPPRSCAPETLQKSATVVTHSGQPGEGGRLQPLSSKGFGEPKPAVLPPTPVPGPGGEDRRHHCHPPSRSRERGFWGRAGSPASPACSTWGAWSCRSPRRTASGERSPAAVTSLARDGQVPPPRRRRRPHLSPRRLGGRRGRWGRESGRAGGRVPALPPASGPTDARRGRLRGSPAATCPAPPHSCTHPPHPPAPHRALPRAGRWG